MGRRGALARSARQAESGDLTLIYIVGFRGIGNDASVEEDDLIRYGHVGVSFVQGGPVYGFHPSHEYVEAVDQSGGDPVNELFGGVTFPGQVFDDTAIILRARLLSERYPEMERRPTVWEWQTSVDVRQFWEIREKVLTQLNHPELTSERYAFPQSDDDPPQTPPDSYNCALWPGSVGIELPSRSGLLQDYIPAIQSSNGRLWEPDSVILKRYRISGA